MTVMASDMKAMVEATFEVMEGWREELRGWSFL